MKKIIAFLLILVVLISILFITINIISPKDNLDSKTNAKENIGENQDNEITGNIVKDDSENNQTRISGNVAGGGGSGGGNTGSGSGEAPGSSSGGSLETGNNPETIPNIELPSDLYEKPCGFYFFEYSICAGTCPDGQCLIDRKSCYCRSV